MQAAVIFPSGLGVSLTGETDPKAALPQLEDLPDSRSILLLGDGTQTKVEVVNPKGKTVQVALRTVIEKKTDEVIIQEGRRKAFHLLGSGADNVILSFGQLEVFRAPTIGMLLQQPLLHQAGDVLSSMYQEASQGLMSAAQRKFDFPRSKK